MVGVATLSPSTHPVQRSTRLVVRVPQRESKGVLVKNNPPGNVRSTQLERERAAYVSKVECDEVREAPDEVFVVPMGPRSHLVPCKGPHGHHKIPLPMVHLLRGGRTVSHTTTEWKQLAGELFAKRLTPSRGALPLVHVDQVAIARSGERPEVCRLACLE